MMIKNKQPQRFKEKVFTLSTLVLCMPAYANSAPQFNTRFVHGAQNITSVVQIARNDGLSEGTFEYDIYIDHSFVETRNVAFKRRQPEGKPQPCLSADDLRRYGIKIPDDRSDTCIELTALIANSRLTADANYQRIDISVPEAFLLSTAHDAVPESAYDDGVNAAFVGYNVNTTRLAEQGQDHDSVFASFANGINLAGWHFRNQSTFSYASGSGRQGQAVSTWVERNIVALRSRLRIGKTYTDDNVFDSIQFTGAQLTSDENMLPDSQRDFAPVVRGVANSNATIEIRQNGYLIYSKNVAPGAFDIDDINPSNQSGDLDVSVIEADGSRRNFSVPYSAVPNMLRADNSRFQFTAGEYRDGYSGGWRPRFVQGTLSYGLSSGTTLYGGLLAAESYNAIATGVAQDLHQFGAISFDITTARAQLASGEASTGQSYRFLYSKSLNQYGTDFRLVGYRYNTSGYYSFSDTINEHNSWSSGYYDIAYDDPNQQLRYPGEQHNKKHYYTSNYNNRRQRFEVSVNQRLWDNASLYVSASQQNYWHNGSHDRTIQLGYNDTLGKINWSVYVQDTRNQYDYQDRSINLTLSIPFDFMDSHGFVSANVMHSQQNGDSYSTSYSNTAFDDRLSWGVQGSTTDRQDSAAGVNAAWQGDKMNVQGGYSAGRNYQNMNMGISGGAMLHAGGVTLMHSPGDTMVLVEAQNADGVHIQQQNGVAIDGNGYAVLTAADAWHYNVVSLNTADIGAGLDIPQAQKKIVPTEKAIGKVVFETFSGRNYLVNAVIPGNIAPPVGAIVRDAKGRNHGLVGLHGALYASGVEDNSRLEVRWGSHTNEHCFIQMPDNHHQPVKKIGYTQITAQCVGS